MRIYHCEVCKNVAVNLFDGGGALNCCSKPMIELKAGVTDGAWEKHVPALTLEGDMLTVQVGETAHPMMSAHYIQFILAEQEDKVQYALLSPEKDPKAFFVIQPEKPVTVYEYCNLHGLWTATLQ